MIKFRLYYDKDKEEEFLNTISKRGYELVNFFLGFYTFKKCDPNEYTYRVDLIGNKNREELEDYMELLEDSGVVLIRRWGPWAIFKKKGEFELYTDKESQIKLYTRIRNMFGSLGILELACMIGPMVSYIQYKERIALYVTILILLTVLAFTNQVFKCNKKIKNLKNNI